MRYRVQRGSVQPLYRTFYVGQTATDANAAPTYVLTDPDGATVASGTWTDMGVGTYGALLAAQSAVGSHTLTTTGTWAIPTLGNAARTEIDQLSVVGGRFFDLGELAALDGIDGFTDLELEVARTVVEEAITDYTEVPWVPEHRRLTLDGDASSEFLLEDLPAIRLLSVKIDGVAQTLTDWTVSRAGRVRADVPLTVDELGQNIVIDYEVGHPQPPSDLRRAALRWARHLLLSLVTSIPDRANMITTEFATFRLSTATDEYPSGLPEVDAVLRRRRGELPVFA